MPMEISFPLPRENLITIVLKEKVTAEEFTTIKNLIDLLEASFVVKPDPPVPAKGAS